jgi:acyl-coenzyme A synthetase/AMP-(fatty) acid ligase
LTAIRWEENVLTDRQTDRQTRAASVIKEIRENRDHSWAAEIEKRAQGKLHKVALKYRGKTVSYGEYIDTFKMIWAPALRAHGIKKGSRVALCVSSTPELAYLFGAISYTGAIFNSLSCEFDSDYLFDIICRSNYDYFFVSEDRVTKMFATLERIKRETNKKVVVIPLDHSLTGGNPFEDITGQFAEFDRVTTLEAISKLTNVISLDEFLKEGIGYSGESEEQSSLDDIFTITYSSGTTDGNKPKGIVHRNKHYIVMGRFHDKDVSGLPNLKDSVTYSIIPTYSNSYVASVLSDTLMEGACVALDPITDNNYFLYALYINQPTMAI